MEGNVAGLGDLQGGHGIDPVLGRQDVCHEADAPLADEVARG